MTNTQLSGVLRERDACWEYCDKLDGNKVRCRFCHKVLNGGISRLKFHLSQIPSKGVNPCTKVKEDVIDKVKAIISAKEEYKEFQLLKRQRVAELKQEYSNDRTKVNLEQQIGKQYEVYVNYFEDHN
ncbi:unnamed protein product [Miscanthus lutarioriparius]|uniref:BED-type domain-containing protein n=1 Tax=Miscanthus lutarioriparius TaxID=422564 RepID=A0A811RDT1_9POAL|nr:unnamed protein product [Miscanthus lutarioriparius]